MMNEEVIQQQIRHNNSLNMFQNSIFLSERLYALNSSFENLHILADTYHKSGDCEMAYHLLVRNSQKFYKFDLSLSEHQRDLIYLFSIICVKLLKYPQAEKGLNILYNQNTRDYSVLYWLGIIMRYTERTKKSISFFQKCLDLNPFMYSAYENICQLGGHVDPATSFHSNKEIEEIKKFTPVKSTKPHMETTPLSTPVSQEKKKEKFQPLFTPEQPSIAGTLFTPGTTISSIRTGTPDHFFTPTPDNFNQKFLSSSVEPSNNSNLLKTPTQGSKNLFFTPEIEREQDNFLPQLNAPPIKRKQKSKPNEQKKLAKLSTSSFLEQNQTFESQTDINDKKEKTSNFMELLQLIAEGYQLFTGYRCREAIEKFLQLPLHQRETGYIISLIAKCYFEMNNYIDSDSNFLKMIDLEPWRLQGLEIYSTVLWHQKKEKELTWLVDHMNDINPNSPYTMITKGNSFSFQKEHKVALKLLQNSIKSNSKIPYAYTLCGHEHFANDDLEESLASFRTAIKVDERHYNAWFGIGKVYYRQQKYDLAQHHFKQALSINPRSSVLYSYIAMTLNSLQNYSDALNMIENSLSIDPLNPIAKFKKSNILVSINQFDLAVAELKALIEIEPNEPSVYSLLGKIYNKLGQKQEAMKYFNIAIDLENPHKDNQSVKSDMSKMFEDDENDEEEEDDDYEVGN